MVFVGYYCCHSLRGLCGLKLRAHFHCQSCLGSQPARAVWIEILPGGWKSCPGLVTACEGCVDWNSQTGYGTGEGLVTACEGCVDWNIARKRMSICQQSHSLRGLCGLKYLDILDNPCIYRHSLRGLCGLKYRSNRGIKRPWYRSQPARAVWIEILIYALSVSISFVTACEGCVDWNS